MREALVNALIHADYSGTTGIRVLKRPDMFEFINPGELRLPLDLIWQGGTSDCRNPSLQRMFQMIGAGEKAGSGIPKITNAWAEQDWRRPSIIENHELNETALRLSLVSLYPDEVVGDLTESLGEAYTSLDKSERAVIVTVASKVSAQHGEVLAIVGGHSRDLTVTLQTLLRKGLLRQNRSGRGCSYSVVRDVEQERGPPEMSRPEEPELTDPIARVIKFVQEHGQIKRGDVMDSIGLSGDSATRLLRKMTELGLLQSRGERRWAYYTPGPNMEIEDR